MNAPEITIKDYNGTGPCLHPTREAGERCPTCFEPYRDGNELQFGTFRKKPIEIVACRFDGGGDSAAWIMDLAPHAKIDWHADLHVLHIHTLEGVMTAVPGDWVIRGVKGELYPCKNDIFLATYEPVEDVA